MKRFLFTSLLLLSLVFSFLAWMTSASPHAFASAPSISEDAFHWDTNGNNGMEEVLFQCDAGDTAVLAGTETDLTRIESGTGSARTTCTGAPQSSTFGLIEVGSVRGGDQADGTGNLEVFNGNIEVGSATLSGTGTVTPVSGARIKVEICLSAGFCMQILEA
jgi:hypothetical protein